MLFRTEIMYVELREFMGAVPEFLCRDDMFLLTWCIPQTVMSQSAWAVHRNFPPLIHLLQIHALSSHQ